MISKPNLSLDALDRLTLADMRDLPVSVLRDLQQKLAEAKVTQEVRAANLWMALADRFAERATQARASNGKDFGTVHLHEPDGTEIVCDLPKDVKWDQTKIRAAFGKLTSEQRTLYGKVELTVPESLFAAAPPEIQAILRDARTAKARKQTFEFKVKKAD